MTARKKDFIKNISINSNNYSIFDIQKAANVNGINLNKMPYCHRILFENIVRNSSSTNLDIFKNWEKNKSSDSEINFYPSRVLMQDFTGVPAIVDLASMRDAMLKLGKDPMQINPTIPVDLVIDHSVQVDSFGKESSFKQNVEKEIERNQERYKFLKWGQNSFNNFQVVPPGTGICHQVNLEYLAKIICTKEQDGMNIVYPDSLVGTDSHTTMINALAVLGWGVGGIEAEAAMLGRPLPMILPEVIGVNLSGELQEGVTATDLVLNITQHLRELGVVGKFVEFHGSAINHLDLANRATISNMAPEYGATCGFFPIDNETLRYLKLTGRSDDHIKLVEDYAKIQNLWYDNKSIPEYTKTVNIDISSISASLAGPKRPQDMVLLKNMQSNFKSNLGALSGHKTDISQKHQVEGNNYKIGHGDLAIAAITSCTNTSNPSVMVAAGLLAKKAIELGAKTKPWVKTSLAPGSGVVTEYLKKGNLDSSLDELGFNLVGYGCTTCIGNSGPLKQEIEDLVKDKNLVLSSVLSGNRNFEGRVHPYVKANYLASPPLVVAYALAGTVNIDLHKDPISTNEQGKNIYLKDIWPSNEEIENYIDNNLDSSMFTSKYKDIFNGDDAWQEIEAPKTSTYEWDDSTYINNPPYFENIIKDDVKITNINNANILALFGDSITTDHISPAGIISNNSPAAKYLLDKKIPKQEFNSYGARRGNHEVMMRGTFANVRIKNLLCPGTEGGVTIHHESDKLMSIYDAAMQYMQQKTPLVIFAGKEYGTGSSRDWAAKGTKLLGVKAVIAESFERIHRSNLIGMGVLPLCFEQNKKLADLNLNGDEKISIIGINNVMKPMQKLECVIERRDGTKATIKLTLQLFTDIEMDYIKYDSIMGSVVKNI